MRLKSDEFLLEAVESLVKSIDVDAVALLSGSGKQTTKASAHAISVTHVSRHVKVILIIEETVKVRTSDKMFQKQNSSKSEPAQAIGRINKN